MNFTRSSLKFVSFNAMSAFNFDSFHGILISRNIVARQLKIIEILKETSPDIINLQEIHTYFILNLYRSKLNYPYVSYKKYLFGPRGGLVTFSKIPFDKTKYVNFVKRGSFFNSSFITKIIKNGMLVNSFSGISLAVINAHATPNLDHDDSKNNRFVKYINAQLLQISNVVKALAENKQIVLLGGDLNVAKKSYTYKKFVKSVQALDLFDKYDSPTQHQEYLPKSKSVKRIDYIFAKNIKTTDVVKINHLFKNKYLLRRKSMQYLSDHIGLYAEIKL